MHTHIYKHVMPELIVRLIRDIYELLSIRLRRNKPHTSCQ